MSRLNPPPFTHVHYQKMLRSAIESGYDFISYSSLNALPPGTCVCLLRHDCDNDLTAAVALARIEEELEISSTYFLMLRSPMYNLLSQPIITLVREIIQRGHRIGLHFDEHFYADVPGSVLAEYVDRERASLFSELGQPIDVVSFHQPSTHILTNQIKLNCVNTYDSQDLLDFHYLSDSNMHWKEDCPSKVFESRRYLRLQLLLHPEWWTAEELTIEEKWNRMLLNNFRLMQESLLARERAYEREQELLIRPLRTTFSTSS